MKKKFPVVAGLTALFAVLAPGICGTALADELIRQANDQESLTLGLAHVHAGQQALDKAGAPVLNEEGGPQMQLGYGSARTRSLFGVPGFYTDLHILLGAGTLAYGGPSYDPSTGVAGPNNGSFNRATESVAVRVGRSVEFGASGRIALTPYLGVGQQAWLSNSSSYSRATSYNHYTAELGALAQASLTRRVVLGVDASIGRELGALQLDGHNLTWPHHGTATSLGLYLDNRTYSDWHQRLILRQDSLRYGEPANAGGVFEPRHASSLAIQLQFGTELDLYKGLFY